MEEKEAIRLEKERKKKQHDDSKFLARIARKKLRKLAEDILGKPLPQAPPAGRAGGAGAGGRRPRAGGGGGAGGKRGDGVEEEGLLVEKVCGQMEPAALKLLTQDLTAVADGAQSAVWVRREGGVRLNPSMRRRGGREDGGGESVPEGAEGGEAGAGGDEEEVVGGGEALQLGGAGAASGGGAKEAMREMLAEVLAAAAALSEDDCRCLRMAADARDAAAAGGEQGGGEGAAECEGGAGGTEGKGEVSEGGDVHCQVAAGVVAAGVAGLDLADKQGLKWSDGEMQALQAALAKFPAGVSDRWDQIAKAVPCKTVKDVMAQVILGP